MKHYSIDAGGIVSQVETSEYSSNSSGLRAAPDTVTNTTGKSCGRVEGCAGICTESKLRADTLPTRETRRNVDGETWKSTNYCYLGLVRHLMLAWASIPDGTFKVSVHNIQRGFQETKREESHQSVFGLPEARYQVAATAEITTKLATTENSNSIC